ncbi:MAG: NADH-quinone oxidoreductase subunit K [Phycisphaerae bacterium]|nr:NADH-quinone oxidoreductase subunit K [Phycisphaerae bacterium]
MSSELAQFFWVFSIAIALVMIAGFYCLLLTYNLIRALIGLELLTKGMTLFIILAGYVTGHTGLAQAMAITLIVIEVVLMVVAVGVVLGIFRHNRSIDARLIRNIKG